MSIFSPSAMSRSGSFSIPEIYSVLYPSAVKLFEFSFSEFPPSPNIDSFFSIKSTFLYLVSLPAAVESAFTNIGFL